MAEVNRIHEQYHGASHHSLPTPGVTDSATDPIAHPSNPYPVDVYITGELSSYSGVSSLSGRFDGINVENIFTNYVDSLKVSLGNSITAAAIVSNNANGIDVSNFTYSTNLSTFNSYNNSIYSKNIAVSNTFKCDTMRCENAYLSSFRYTTNQFNILVSEYYANTIKVNNVLGLQELIDRKSNLQHKHNLNSLIGGDVLAAKVNDFYSLLEQKSDINHTHLPSEISGYGNILSSFNTQISSLCSSLEPKADIQHTHSLSDIVDYGNFYIDLLSSKIDNKAIDPHTHNISSIDISPLTALNLSIDKHIGYMPPPSSAIQSVYLSNTAISWYEIDGWYTASTNTPLKRLPNSYESVILYTDPGLVVFVDIDDERWVQPYSINTGAALLMFSSKLSATINCSITGEVVFADTVLYSRDTRSRQYDPGFIIYDTTYQHQLSDVVLSDNTLLPPNTANIQSKSPAVHSHTLSSDFNLQALNFLFDDITIDFLELSAERMFTYANYLTSRYRSIDFLIDYINDECESINANFNVPYVNVKFSNSSLNEYTSGYNQLQQLASIATSKYITQNELNIYKRLYNMQSLNQRGIFLKTQNINKYTAIVPTSIYFNKISNINTQYHQYLDLIKTNNVLQVRALRESIPYLIYNLNTSNLIVEGMVINSNAYIRSVVQSPASAIEQSNNDFTTTILIT